MTGSTYAGRLSLVNAVAPLSIEDEALAHGIVLPYLVLFINALPTEFQIPAAKRPNARLTTSRMVLIIQLFGGSVGAKVLVNVPICATIGVSAFPLHQISFSGTALISTLLRAEFIVRTTWRLLKDCRISHAAGFLASV